MEVKIENNLYPKEVSPFPDVSMSVNAEDVVTATFNTFTVRVLAGGDERGLINACKPATIEPKDKHGNASTADGPVIRALLAAAEQAIDEAEADGLAPGYTVCMNKSEPDGKVWKTDSKLVYAHFLKNGDVVRSELTDGTGKKEYVETAWFVRQS